VGHDEPVTALVWMKDGRTLISGAADGYVVAWNVADGSVRARIRAHSKAVTALALHRDGVLLATAGTDARLRLWTFTAASFVELLSTTPDKVINCLAWSHDGKLLISGGVDKMLRYWSGREFASLRSIKAHDGAIATLAVGP
jgi:WD40 repeat protein